MKESLWEKCKKFFLQKDSLIICILTGVLLLVIVWPMDTEKKEEQAYLTDMEEGKISYQEKNMGIDQGNRNEFSDEKASESSIDSMEAGLEEFLSMMEGVGKVKAMITLDTLGEKVLEKDIPMRSSVITESDSQGGERSTNDTDSQETTVYTVDENGNKIPYVKTEILPKIKGITVVCEGGESVVIQKNITEVIQALFGIEPHKIKIVKMKQME